MLALQAPQRKAAGLPQFAHSRSRPGGGGVRCSTSSSSCAWWRVRGPRGEAEDETGDANLLEDEYDCETYDDAEFYQQVLKEFLESQAQTAGDLARARTTKRRKVVDRKASKGRKIRYHVHDKLVNFMVPAAFERPEFANKLFGSLFAYNAQ